MLTVVVVADSLDTERDQLAPHVAQWQKVQELESQYKTARVQLLKDQQEHGTALINYQQQQVSTTCGCLCRSAVRFHVGS